MRVISMRKANKREERKYGQQLFQARNQPGKYANPPCCRGDPDTRDLTEAEQDELRPVDQVLPIIFGKNNAEHLMRQRGRFTIAVKKELVSVRYYHDVLHTFRASGKSWQTRMNKTLREDPINHGMSNGNGR